MKPKFGVVVFPGSNCDHDAYYAMKKVLNYDAEFLWHKETDIKGCDVIILPGGFSYGDYLRTGAIARFSPIMNSVIDFANKGGIVIGICNGFQILSEAGLLPGVLLKNKGIKFVCKDSYLKVENKSSVFTQHIDQDVIKIPIKHGDGNFFVDEDTFKRLKDNDQIAFRYATEKGEIIDDVNPNGAISNIAGVLNEKKNVLGMMPHPENACDPILRKTDGQLIFKSIAESIIK